MLLALPLILAPAQPPEPVELPRHASERACASGRFVFFEPGSDRLDETGHALVREWSRWLQQSGTPGHIEVEANADGFGSSYNRALSLRRAHVLRRILVENGLGDRDIEIRLQDWFGRSPGSHEEETGNVRLLNNEPPVLANGRPIIRECF